MTEVKAKAVAQVPSSKLEPKRGGLFKELCVRNPIVTVNVYEVHNVVFIEHITLHKTSKEARPVKEVERHDKVSSEADSTRDEYAVSRIFCCKDDSEGKKV